MRISKFNHEGYYDPTTYRAFKNIEKDEKRKARFRPLVYICSPYAGGNKERTTEWSKPVSKPIRRTRIMPRQKSGSRNASFVPTGLRL